jgi:hypothetical protein
MTTSSDKLGKLASILKELDLERPILSQADIVNLNPSDLNAFLSLFIYNLTLEHTDIVDPAHRKKYEALQRFCKNEVGPMENKKLSNTKRSL